MINSCKAGQEEHAARRRHRYNRRLFMLGMIMLRRALFWSVLSLLSLSLMCLAGCGQKGPLYLPVKAPVPAPLSAPAPVPANAPDEDEAMQKNKPAAMASPVPASAIPAPSTPAPR